MRIPGFVRDREFFNHEKHEIHKKFSCRGDLPVAPTKILHKIRDS